ncbi:hypothetical protein L7F22_018804 [Adiantum nelumboides]|nr:hypothetical protein [Adiantum nelumboides]
MTRSQMEKRKRSGLEITCIGVLYQGPWEKKYWSSSRGKDRYPYPVGYQAVRCINGKSYHMEIQEGARGPSFVVASGQGLKWSADTPTIAWHDAMKKTSSFSSRTRGRLLSSDINGSEVEPDGEILRLECGNELFGFLDLLVQRLFRELVLVHEGEAQPDDCLEKQAVDVVKQKSTMAGCSEGFGWSSSRTVQVRKSRTSIVRFETTKGSKLSCESSLKQSCSTKGHRRRLKLVKPPKRTRESADAEISGPCEHPLPQIPSPISSQAREGCIQSDPKTEQMQEALCETKKGAFQEISKDKLLKGTVIPDSYDEFPSQMSSGQAIIHVKTLPLVIFSSKNNNRDLAPTSGDVPSLHGSENLSDPGDFEGPLSLKHKIQLTLSEENSLKCESISQDLSSPAKNAPDIQLNHTVVPDSCDIRSQDLCLQTKNPLEIHLKNTIIPDSFDMESLHEAHTVTQGVALSSQTVLEQGSALFDKFDSLPSHSAKEESQSSEGNTQKGESDSFGQELTKSMISLLLPQALQIYNKKGRKRKKPVTSMVSEVDKVDLPSAASELRAMDEKGPFGNSKEVERLIVKEHTSKKVYKRGMLAASDGICAGTDENQLNSVKIGIYNKLLNNEENEFHNTCKIACVETSNEVKQLCDKVTNYESQPSKSLNSGSDFFVDDTREVHQHEVPKDSSHPCVNYTVLPCKTPVPESFAPITCLSKGQLYSANDRVEEPSSGISLQSLIPEDVERSLADHDLLQSLETEGICSPVAIIETKDSFVVEIQTEVEKATSLLEVSKFSTKVISDQMLGIDAMETALKPFAEQEMSSMNMALIHGDLQLKHSVISTEVMGLLACQETSTVNDLSAGHRTADASELEVKDCSPQSGTFVPKICLEQPMPILAMKITVQDGNVRLLICCGDQDATRLLLLYQLSGKELLPSIFSSTTFDILDCNFNPDCRGLVESNGIHFAPGRQELFLLGMFKIRELAEEKHTSPLEQEDSCLCDIQVVVCTAGKLHVASRLSASGSQLYCVLPVDTCTVIAGGEHGLVIGWTMDTSWRSCKESFTLPLSSLDRGSSSRILQLSRVSTLPSIIVGCDDQGLIAIWNFSSRRLLKSLKLSVESPSQLHILKMDVIGHSDCEEYTEVPWMDRTEDSSVTELVIASLLLSTASCQGLAAQHSDGQSVSKSWNLEILKRDGNSVMFSLDQLHQRISTVEVSEKLGLAGTYNGCVLLWDTMSGSVIGTLRQPKDEPVICLAIDPASDIIAVAGSIHALVYAK